ncbi:DUF6786 family protein [candidate division KSB1 bacterium]
MNDLISALEGRTTYTVLERGDVTLVVNPEIGAKAIGLSADGSAGRNLLWFNPQAAVDSFWQGEPGWNLGGLRSWIAPEASFYLDSANNWFVPSGMDPGNYKETHRSKDRIEYTNDFAVTDPEGRDYPLRLVRSLTVLDLPPDLARAPARVKFAGITQEHSLTNLGTGVLGGDLKRVGLWSLLQINPPGTMIIPIAGAPEDAYRNYFNPIPSERMTELPGVLTVKIDGEYRCKLGIRPEAARGVLGYLWRPKRGDLALYVFRFDVDPKGVYLDHPWEQPYDYGDAVQIYNDDGAMGGFAEMECHGPSEVLEPGQTESHSVELLVFSGREEDLISIGTRLLRLPLERLEFYF